jgi:hypothetical protein
MGVQVFGQVACADPRRIRGEGSKWWSRLRISRLGGTGRKLLEPGKGQSMKRRLIPGLASTALLLGSMQLVAHDDKIHKATTGEVIAAAADGLDFKTSDGLVKVKYSSRTKFELNGKPADKAAPKAAAAEKQPEREA